MNKTALGLLLWLLGIAPAMAFLGIGDITFDPPVHAEIISLFNQTLAIYHQILSEVHSVQAVQSTLRTAEQDVTVVTNGGLARYERAAMPSGLPRDLGRVLGTIGGAGAAAQDANGYYKQQLHRFQRLGRLRWLSKGAHHDVRVSTYRLGEKTSGDVTAQATASLATLAATHARSDAKRSIRRSAERRNQSHLPRQAARIYQAIGGAS